MTNPFLRHPRSMLFVSGEKAERFPKAMAAGADVVCIDLEDAVHPERKVEARERVLLWLRDQTPVDTERSTAAVALRINGLRTRDGLGDVLALVDANIHVDYLLVPKVEEATELQYLEAWAGAHFDAAVALIESPLGVENAPLIARGSGKLAALMLGGADLSAELDAQFNWEGLLHARGCLVNAAKAANLQAWDVPHVDLSDVEGLARETRQAISVGFDCKTAIHPQQIPTIHAAFTPTAAQAEWAQVLLKAVPEGQSSGAFLFQGRMVDAPLLRKARRVAELMHLSQTTR